MNIMINKDTLMNRADGGVFIGTLETGVVFLAAPLPFLPLWLLLFRFGRRPRLFSLEKALLDTKYIEKKFKTFNLL